VSRAGGNPLVLAVDLGTSGMKVALFNLRGEVLGWQSQPLRTQLLPGGGAEQSPEEWWQTFLAAAGRLLATNPAWRTEIRAVCCSTQGEGTIPVDREGRALMNAISWMDMRGGPYLRRRMRGLVNVGGAGLLKLWRWIRLTGGMPSVTGKDPAGHMLLVRECFPEVYRRTYKFLNVLDYLNLRLTGRFVATCDSILTSWVTDNRDLGRIRYDPALIRQSGIDADKFPDIVSATEVLGPLRADVAATLGLPNTVKVVAGAIDNSAAAVGSGAVADFAGHLYLGTSSWIAAHVPWKKTDLRAALASVPSALPGRYLLTALQATAGGNLRFLRDNVLPNEPGGGRMDAFALVDGLAARAPAGSNGLIYTPWIWGERAPVEDPHLRAGLFNLSLDNDRADILRAVLEGVALNTRWLLAPVERFLGRPTEGLNLVGGGARSDLWCQIFADVLRVRVRQVQDPIQANARGAAFIAAAGLGEIALAEVGKLVPIRRTYEPQAEHRAVYDERFQSFRALHRQLAGLYRKINAAGPSSEHRG